MSFIYKLVCFICTMFFLLLAVGMSAAQSQQSERGKQLPDVPVVQLHKMSVAQLHQYARARDATAQYILGYKYLKGEDVVQDDVMAVQFFEAAAQNNHKNAQNFIGFSYAVGRGTKVDCNKSREYFEKGKENAGTYFFLQAHLADFSMCIRKDTNLALKQYTVAADIGSTVAQHSLGLRLYKLGDEGADAVFAKALKTYEQRAATGHVPSMQMAGYYYLSGFGTAKDSAKAHEYLLPAADMGDMFAQFYMGELYTEGMAVQKDAAQAFAWYSKAAEQGLPDAYLRLADMYKKGEGVAADAAKAVEFEEKYEYFGHDYFFAAIAAIGAYYDTLPW